MQQTLRRAGILVATFLILAPFATACKGSNGSGPDSEPTEEERALALGLIADRAVIRIFNAAGAGSDLADVGEALGQGDVALAKTRLSNLQQVVADGRAASSGEDRVVFAGADLIMAVLIDVLRVPREAA